MIRQWHQTFKYLSSRYRDALLQDTTSDDIQPDSGIVCLQPFYFMEVTTSGDVYTCCPGWVKFSIGNIRNRTIAEVWNSSKAKYIRRKMYRGEWKQICNSICPRISQYTYEKELIPFDYLDKLDYLTSRHVAEIRMRKESLDSPPTVFNLSNSTICNLSCIMCDRHNQHNDPRIIQKTSKEIFPYLQTARRLILAGMGDPLARPDTRDLLMNYHNLNPDLRFDLATNGLLLAKYWDRIKHQKFGSLLISVDASRKETYDKIRIGGSWDELMNSLALVQENKDKFSSVTLNMTVMRHNYREIPEFIDLAESYGFNVSFQRIRGKHTQNFFVVKDEKIIEELKTILESEQCSHRRITLFFEDLLEFTKNNEVKLNVLSEEIHLTQDDNLHSEEGVTEVTPEENVTEVPSDSIVTKLQNDAPLFHDDGTGGLVTWFSNISLLTELDKLSSPGLRTIETGCGYSTLIFLSRKCLHTCIVSIKEEIERITDYCSKTGVSLEGSEFIIGESHNILPSYPGRDFDLFFLDGAHRFPFPIIDWFFGALLLKENGLMVLDDTDIISCHILCKFMLEDSHWEAVAVKENFGIFRKLGGHNYPLDWHGQTFSRNKIESEKAILDILSPSQDLPEQMR